MLGIIPIHVEAAFGVCLGGQYRESSVEAVHNICTTILLTLLVFGLLPLRRSG